jgi:hypothetical protein
LYIEFHNARSATKLQTQPGIEINMTHGGRGQLEIDGKRQFLYEGHVAIFDATRPHQLTCAPGEETMRSVLCLIPESMARPPGSELPGKLGPGANLQLNLGPSRLAQLDRLLGRLAVEMLSRPPLWKPMACALTDQILIGLEVNIR